MHEHAMHDQIDFKRTYSGPTTNAVFGSKGRACQWPSVIYAAERCYVAYGP